MSAPAAGAPASERASPSRSGRGIRGTLRGTLRAELHEPLFRNGHALVLSSFATATIGFAYWVLAARGYTPAIVGRSSVALTSLSFVGGIAQCNLASALWRFAPGAGRSLRRFVLGCYGFSIVVSVALALLFFDALPTIAPSLHFIAADPALRWWFVVSTAAQAIFVLEDGVLTGLRRTTLVPIENASFSLLKALLVIAIAAARPETGIFLSWTIATIATIVPTNIYLFARAIPRHMHEQPDGDVHLRDLVRYVPYDYGAWLFWAASTTLLPLVVIATVGADGQATFNMAWVITYSLYLVPINLGSSLVVETAGDQTQLPLQCRRVMVHLAKLLVPACVVIAAGAPLIMRVFGHHYAASGASTLRLLAISAPPFILTSTLQSALRAMRRTRAVLAIDATLCTIAVALAWLLLPRIGVVAAGVGWLIAQYLVAGGLFALLLARYGRRVLTVPLPVAAVAPVVPVPERDPLLLAAPRRASRSEHQVRQALALAEPVVAQAMSELLPGLRSEPSIVPADDAATGLVALTTGLVSVRGFRVALVQIAGDDQASAALRHEQAMLSWLGGEESLGCWRRLLPVRRLGAVGARPVAVELLGPGLDAAALLARLPALWPALARRGLEVLASLHLRTPADPGGCEPPAVLVESSWRLVERRIAGRAGTQDRTLLELGPKVRRLERALAADAGVARSLVHGRLGAATVRVAPDSLALTGLRGFWRARHDGVPAIDSAGYVLRLIAASHRRSLSEVVAEVGRGGQLAEDAAALLAPELHETPLALGDLALWTLLDELAGLASLSPRLAVAPARVDVASPDSLERAG